MDNFLSQGLFSGVKVIKFYNHEKTIQYPASSIKQTVSCKHLSLILVKYKNEVDHETKNQ